MSLIINLIVFIFPLIFQIIYGRKAIGNSIKLSFWQITFIGIIAQFISPVINFIIVANNLESNGNKCGMALVGVFIFTILFSFLLLIIIFIQYRIKKYYEEK